MLHLGGDFGKFTCVDASWVLQQITEKTVKDVSVKPVKLWGAYN